MPSGLIGDLGFDLIKGLPQLQTRTRTESWQTPGIDGYGVQTIGQGDTSFNLTCVKYVNTSVEGSINDDANALIADSNALQGTFITIVDNCGDTYDGICVLSVNTNSQRAKKAVKNFKNTAAIRVEILFECIRATVNS